MFYSLSESFGGKLLSERKHHYDRWDVGDATPSPASMHIRESDVDRWYVGGADNSALCAFKGRLFDHVMPFVRDADLSKICPACRKAYLEKVKP